MLTKPEDLVRHSLTDQSDWLEAVGARYAIGVPEAWLEKLSLSPALAGQCLPDRRELESHKAEHIDPIGDEVHSPVPGVVHRYPDRVLFKVVQACAMYCRFCFRRASVGPGQGAMTPEDIETAIDYVSSQPDVWEVILTGGDPLVLSPRRISDVINAIASVPHIKIVRIHTRIPVAAPDLLSDDMIEALTSQRLTCILSVHANHADEFSSQSGERLEAAARAGIPLIGQTVLLKGVNDHPDVLRDLFKTMVEHRVMPYYLHHPDLAPGTSHFRVPLATGQKLMASLQATLSGIARPTYMLDIPGGFGKVPVNSDFVTCGGDGSTTVRDPGGTHHIYDPGLPE